MPIKFIPKVAVVRVADAFAKTGELLLEQTPEATEWPYPFVVNYALSIELYLKSYLSEDDLVPFIKNDDGTTILSCSQAPLGNADDSPKALSLKIRQKTTPKAH